MEFWPFVGGKQTNVTPEWAERDVAGEVWTFIAIEVKTNPVVSRIASRFGVAGQLSPLVLLV